MGAVVLRHARLRSSARSPHRAGRLTPDSVLEALPEGRTICGAAPTTDDLGNRTARSKAGRVWLTCPACRAALETEL